MPQQTRGKKRAISRRRFLTGAGATGLATFSVIRRAAAQEDKRLVIYNFDGNLGKFYRDHWIDPFATATGIQIDTITMTGSAPPMAKIKALVDAGKPDADVIPMQLSDYVFATRNNMLSPIAREEIPEYQNLYPQFIYPHGPGLVLWCYGIAHNTEKIKDPPTAWRDLWSPAYKGKAGLNEALFEQALQMVNLAFKGKTTPVDDETFAHLKRLRPNLVSLWTTGAQAEQLLRTGEVWITPLWNGRVFKLKDEGVPLDFVVPKEGFFVRHNPFCIPNGAKHPGWAKKWLNYVCHEDRQRVLAEKFYYASSNKKVTYTPDVAKRVVVSSPDVVAKAVREDFDGILDNLPQWRKSWDAWQQS